MSERLRVARATIAVAPSHALTACAVSFSAIREITRVATRATERDWVNAARGASARDIERRFTVDGKAVVIRALGGSRFVVSSFGPPTMIVNNIAAGERACVSGIKILSSYPIRGSIQVLNCPGEVVLEDLQCSPQEGWDTKVQLEISSCDNVSINGLLIERTIEDSAMTAAVLVSRSRVRMTDVDITGKTPLVPVPPYPPGHAIELSESLLILAHCRVIGGHGGGGSILWDDGGPGGDGIHATASTVIALGDENQLISGGDGADAFFNFGWLGHGGDGGDGFHGDGLLVSRVPLAGGSAGQGEPPGKSGAPYVGSVSRHDVIPCIELTPDLVPGAAGTLMLHNVMAGTFLAFVSNRGGFLYFEDIFGVPISVLPGDLFVGIPIGHAPPHGTLAAPFVVPSDPDLTGLPLHVQAVLLSDEGVTYASQAIARVIGR